MSRPGLPSTAACYEGVDEARALYEWNHAKQLLRITAGRGEEPTVLLIDETDKADVEIEGLLLEERIVRLKVPRIDTVLVESIVRVVNALRDMELRKAPSVAETIDWARTLVALVGALRRHGVRAGTSETVDAAAVVEVLGIDERDRSREGLASALIRRGGQRSVFDAVFDLYFPTAVGSSSFVRESPMRADVELLRAELASALAADDAPALAQLAVEAVEGFGQYGTAPGAGAGGAWSAKQTLDQVQPQTLIVRALAEARGSRIDAPAFTERLDREEIRQRVRRFRSQVEGEARRRTSEVRGREQIARHAIAPATEPVDFLTVNRRHSGVARVRAATPRSAGDRTDLRHVRLGSRFRQLHDAPGAGPARSVQ